ncbi:MAG: hypothetical protein Q7U36_02975 [bacterium]|nr:hypothetical protein [bacterium]
MFDVGFFNSYAIIGQIVVINFLLISIIQSIVWYKIFKKKLLFFVSLVVLSIVFVIFDLDIAFSINIILLIISIVILIFLKIKNKNEKK